MSNKVRGRKLSRTRSKLEKRPHRRTLVRDQRDRDRVRAAVIAELEADEFALASWPEELSSPAEVVEALKATE